MWRRIAVPEDYLLRRYSRLALLAALVALGAAVSPHFLLPQNLFNVLRETGFIALISLGMTLAMLTGGLDLSVGSVVALASCVAASWLVNGRVAAGVAVALAVGLTVGLVNGVSIAWLHLPPFVATYGTMNAARGLALLYTGGYSIFGFPRDFRWVGVGRWLGVPAPFWVTLAVAAVLYLLMHHTVFGRIVYATGANPKAARYAGLPTAGAVVAVYALSGLLSGAAGLVLAARVDAAEPNTGELFPLDAITAAALGGTAFSGGVGSVGGTLVGSVLLAIINNLINLTGVSSYWSVFFKGALVLGALTFDFVVRRRGASS